MRGHNYVDSVILLTTCAVMFFIYRMAVLRAINKLTFDKFLTDQDLSRLFFFLPSSGRDILYQFKIKNQR